MNFQLHCLFIFIQSFISCHQNSDDAQPQSKNIIYQTDDNGNSWQDVSNSLPDSIDISSILVADERVLLASSQGMYTAAVGSEIPSWKQEILFDKNVSKIFAGKPGIYGRVYPYGLFQEVKGTGIWKPVFSELTEHTPFCILEVSDDDILAGCEKGIFKSSDHGKSWKLVLEEQSVTSIISNGTTIMAASFHGIFRSMDQGEHWERLLLEEHTRHDVVLCGDVFYAISNPGGSWKEIMSDPDKYSGKLRVSVNGGLKWQRLDAGLFQMNFILTEPEKQFPQNAIRDIICIGDQLFCSVSRGVMRSNDGGNSWKLVLPAHGNKLYSLAVSGKRIYAVPVFNGC